MYIIRNYIVTEFMVIRVKFRKIHNILREHNGGMQFKEFVLVICLQKAI